MTTQPFVMLQRASDLWKDNEQWQANVAKNAADGYVIIYSDDDSSVREFQCDELDFVEDVKVYEAVGAPNVKRFYSRNIVTYKVKATGELCVMWYEDIYDC